jgi:hypothetical protein
MRLRANFQLINELKALAYKTETAMMVNVEPPTPTSLMFLMVK